MLRILKRYFFALLATLSLGLLGVTWLPTPATAAGVALMQWGADKVTVVAPICDLPSCAWTLEANVVSPFQSLGSKSVTFEEGDGGNIVLPITACGTVQADIVKNGKLEFGRKHDFENGCEETTTTTTVPPTTTTTTTEPFCPTRPATADCIPVPTTTPPTVPPPVSGPPVSQPPSLAPPVSTPPPASPAAPAPTVAPVAPIQGPLAFTGVNWRPFARVGLGLMALGSLLLFRRRRMTMS